MNRGLIYPVLLLFGCGGGDTHKAAAPIPDDPTCIAPAACDIEDATCQAAVLKLTSCIRGDGEVPLPPIRVIDTDQFRSELVDQMMSEGAGASPDDAAEDAALIALQLLPSGKSSVDAEIDAQLQNVAAYYDFDTQSVTVISRAETVDPNEAMYDLSHELTHYLQDRTVGFKTLKDKFPQTNDGSEASRNLTEGEAVMNSTRAYAFIDHLSPEHVAWGKLFDSLDDSLFGNLNASTSRLATAALTLPYSIGTRFVGNVWIQYDRAHVDELFDAAPHSVVDWLAGYHPPIDDSGGPTLLQPLDCGPPAAPDGFVLEELDSFGVTGAIALLSAVGTISDYDLVSRLRGDAIALYVSVGVDDVSKAPILVAWRMRFDRPESANSFASELESLDLRAHVFGREIVFGAATVPSAAGFGAEAFSACPKLEDLQPVKSAMNGMAAIRFPHALRRPRLTRR